MSESPPAPLARRQNHGWIYFFSFIFVASVGVAGFMIWFSRNIQLTPDELKAAEQRWQDANIKDYNLLCKKKLNLEDAWTIFAVKIRGGKVEEVRMNGKLLEKEDDGEDPRPYHSMNAQFRYLDRFMEIDQRPKAPKVYFIASFDPKTGAILRYTRYDSHQKQRVEMQFTLTAVEK